MSWHGFALFFFGLAWTFIDFVLDLVLMFIDFPEWKCGMENDEEDTETHGAIHTREAYEKLSIVYEKVREGCHYDVSCVRRYHFYFDFFITNSLQTAQFIPKTKHSLWKPIIVAQSPKSDHTEFGFCTGA